MANRIPRAATKLDVTFLVTTSAGEENTQMIAEKNENKWIGTDKNGKKYHLFLSHLRNENICKVTVIG